MCILWELRTLAQILFAVQQRGMAWENDLACREPSTAAFPVEYLPSRARLQRDLGGSTQRWQYPQSHIARGRCYHLATLSAEAAQELEAFWGPTYFVECRRACQQ